MKLNPLKLSIIGAIIGSMIVVSVPVQATQTYNPATVMPLQKNQKLLIAQTSGTDIEKVSNSYNVLEIPGTLNANGTIPLPGDEKTIKEQVAALNINNRSVLLRLTLSAATTIPDADMLATAIQQLIESYGFDGLSMVLSANSLPNAQTLTKASDAAKIVQNYYASHGANCTTILYTDSEQWLPGATLYEAMQQNQAKYSYIAMNSANLTALDTIIQHSAGQSAVEAERLIITDQFLKSADIDTYINDLSKNGASVRGISTENYEAASFTKLTASNQSLVQQYTNPQADIQAVKPDSITENSARINFTIETNNLNTIQSADIIDTNNTILASKAVLNNNMQIELTDLTKNTSYEHLQIVLWYKDINNNLVAKSAAIPTFTTTTHSNSRQAAGGASPKIDTQAPSEPQSLVSSHITDHSALLTWEPATDNIQVKKYSITVTATGTDIVKQFESTDAFYMIEGLNPESNYTIAIAAQDAANNRSTIATTSIRTGTVEQWSERTAYYLGDRVSLDNNVYENRSIHSVNSRPTVNDSNGLTTGWMLISGADKTAIPDWNAETIYPGGFVVFKDNHFWQANKLTTAADIPGQSEAWQVTTNVPNDIYEERLPLFKSPLHTAYTVSTEYGGYAGHIGTDLAVPTGTQVYPVIKGTVVYTAGGAIEGNTAANGGYGNVVAIAHTVQGVQYVTVYGHLSSINVNVGDSVTTNTVIGLSGNTGMSTGPHLHLEVLKNATQFDLNKSVRMNQALDSRLIIPL